MTLSNKPAGIDDSDYEGGGQRSFRSRETVSYADEADSSSEEDEKTVKSPGNLLQHWKVLSLTRATSQ